MVLYFSGDMYAFYLSSVGITKSTAMLLVKQHSYILCASNQIQLVLIPNNPKEHDETLQRLLLFLQQIRSVCDGCPSNLDFLNSVAEHNEQERVPTIKHNIRSIR